VPKTFQPHATWLSLTVDLLPSTMATVPTIDAKKFKTLSLDDRITTMFDGIVYMTSELAEVKKTTEFISSKYDEIIEKQTKIEGELLETRGTVNSLKAEVDDLRIQNAWLNTTTNGNLVIISGIPESNGENLQIVAEKILQEAENSSILRVNRIG